MTLVCISGGFDPIHIGHVRLIQEACQYGSLWIILNNDNWLLRKKGFFFMPQEERKEILEAIYDVAGVQISFHEPNCEDMSVCKELEYISPDIFCNGGDRVASNIPEYQLCESLGIEMIFNVGGEKIQSSSKLVEKSRGCRIVIEGK